MNFLFKLYICFSFSNYFAYLQTERPVIIFLREKDQNNTESWINNFIATSRSSKLDFDLKPLILDLENEEDNNKKLCEAFAESVSVIIDATWFGNDLILELANSSKVPYVRIDVSIGPFLLFLDEYLTLKGSSDVTLIFDDSTNIDQLLLYWIYNPKMRLVISETLDTPVVERIKKIRPIPNSFAIVATTSNMNHYIKKVLSDGAVTLPERWNLLFLDFKYENFTQELIFNKPLSLLKVNPQICCDLLKTNPCSCPDDFSLQEHFFYLVMEEIYKVFDVLLKSNYQIVSAVKCKETPYNAETFQRFNEIFENYIEKNRFLYNRDDSITLKISGDVEVEDKMNLRKIATYNSIRGVTVNQGEVITPIRTFYRIGITHALPWSFKEKDDDGNEYWTGYCVDLAKKLSEVMNFDFEFVEPENGTFGNKFNGRWDGVVGDLERGETDMAITALVMTADKEEVIDFVPPYFEQTGISIVMRRPVRKTSLFKFMTVLKLEVWLSIVAAVTVTGFFIWFLDKYSPFSGRNNKSAYPYPCREFTLKESFWFALTSFTPQGGGEAPKSLSGRTLIAAYWLFVVLMLATFTANLAAFLTVERMQTPVQSLEQLSQQSRINYTVVNLSDTHQFFINMKNAEDTLYRMWKELTLNASTDDIQYRVWDYPIKEQWGHILIAINDSNPVANASEGFRLVNEHLDADFAFIHDSSEIKYEITRDCNLTEVGEVFAEKPYAIAVQQGSQITDDISRALLNLQTDRYLEYLQSKYWNNSVKGVCPYSDDNEGITLESLGGVFIATLCGLGLAMITLGIEIFYYRNKQKNVEVQEIKQEKKPNLIKPQTITIGTEFNPVKPNQQRDIFSPLYYPRSRNRISFMNFKESNQEKK